MSPAVSALVEIVAPLCVLGIFAFAMRAIIRADRSERDAIARLDAERDATE